MKTTRMLGKYDRTTYDFEYMCVYLYGEDMDARTQSITWDAERPTFDWRQMNVDSKLSACELGCNFCNKCVQWEDSTCGQDDDGDTIYQWSNLLMHMHYSEGNEPSLDYLSRHDWQYSKVREDYPILPDTLEVTDENVMTVAWISARTAMRTMCKIGRNMSYASEVRRQDKRAEIIMDIMARMDNLDGRLQTLVHHKKAKVGGVWIPVDSFELVMTSAGKKHDDMYTAVSDTLGDYFPIYNESVCGILQGIQDNGYDNVWDAFADGCRAVHKYVDGQRAYRDRTYHKQHADSDTRQDDNGLEIKAYHDEDENGHLVRYGGLLDVIEDDIAIAQYIDSICQYFSGKRREYVRQVLQMAVDGYSRKDIAIATGNRPHVVYDIFRKVQDIVHTHDIIPTDGHFRVMTR